MLQFLTILLFLVRHIYAIPIDGYQAELTGTVGGLSFSRTAEFYLAPSLDAFLVSGFPFATPEVGAIWLSSNREFYKLFQSKYPSGTNQLMTVVSNGAGTVTYTIREDVVAQSIVLNSMTKSSGIFAFDYILRSGTMVCTFSGTQVQGTIDVIATSRNSLIDERYVATFVGVRTTTFEF